MGIQRSSGQRNSICGKAATPCERMKHVCGIECNKQERIPKVLNHRLELSPHESPCRICTRDLSLHELQVTQDGFHSVRNISGAKRIGNRAVPQDEVGGRCRWYDVIRKLEFMGLKCSNTQERTPRKWMRVRGCNTQKRRGHVYWWYRNGNSLTGK